jgi:histidinol-phosphatase
LAHVEDYGADLALALSMADAADAISYPRFGAVDLVVETKPDLTPVSDADRDVEQTVRAHLAEHRPDDALMGEEFGSTGASSRRWIVDPIDGTKNFIRGVPVWATLIALMDGDESVVGVVSAPALGRRWWAAAGAGAWTTALGGEPRRLQVSRVAKTQRLAGARAPRPTRAADRVDLAFTGLRRLLVLHAGG